MRFSVLFLFSKIAWQVQGPPLILRVSFCQPQNEMSLIRYRTVEIVGKNETLLTFRFHNRCRLGQRQLNLLVDCLLKLKTLKFNDLC